MSNRVTFIMRWCPTCQCLRDEAEWKTRSHYYECLRCHTEVRATCQDRIESLMERLYVPLDWLDTKVYAVGMKYRVARRWLKRMVRK